MVNLNAVAIKGHVKLIDFLLASKTPTLGQSEKATFKFFVMKGAFFFEFTEVGI